MLHGGGYMEFATNNIPYMLRVFKNGRKETKKL